MVCELTERAKGEFYNYCIIKCHEDQRTIFKEVENVIDHISLVLLTNASSRDTARVFGPLFRDKAANIRNGLESGLINDREGMEYR